MHPFRDSLILAALLPAIVAACQAATTSLPHVGPPCRVTAPPPSIPLGGSLMEPICDGVYAEPGSTPAQIDELRRDWSEARASIVTAFGELRGGRPVTLFCRTADCKIAFGGPPASAAANDLGFSRDGVQTANGFVSEQVVVVTAPVSRTASILTHEFVHAEMKAWLPYDALPTWFDEGMATYVAREPDCRGQTVTADFDVTRLDTRLAWEEHLRATHATRETYCAAFRAVDRWATQFGDTRRTAAALRRLLRSVADGGTFDLSRAH